MAKYVITFKKIEATTNIIDADSTEEAKRIADKLLEGDFYMTLDERLGACYEPDWETEVERFDDWESFKDRLCYQDDYMTPEEIRRWIGEEE